MTSPVVVASLNNKHIYNQAWHGVAFVNYFRDSSELCRDFTGFVYYGVGRVIENVPRPFPSSSTSISSDQICCHLKLVSGYSAVNSIRLAPSYTTLVSFISMLTFKRQSADCFILNPSPYRAVNTFHLGYKNQSVYAVSGTSRCLFSDKYKTQIQCRQSVQLLNVKLAVHHVTARL
jgi:hypothetical protein